MTVTGTENASMNSRGAGDKLAILLTVILLAVTAASLSLRSYYHELAGDEVMYTFVWEQDDTTRIFDENHVYKRQISSLGDVMQTPVRHYMTVNGRIFVHIVEQMFYGKTGYALFCIVNALSFLLLVFLAVTYGGGRENRRNCLYWLTAVLTLMYLFPETIRLWTSINLAPNYLLPAILSTGFLIIIRRMEKRKFTLSEMTWACITAFFAGWSNESFAAGLSGGTFIYAVLRRKQLRRQEWTMLLVLWAATMCLCLAPGNLLRFFGHKDTGERSLPMLLASGVNLLTELKIFWCAVVLLIAKIIRGKERFRDFVKGNELLLLVLSAGVAFNLVVNRTARSGTGVELFSFLLLLRWLSSKELFKKNSRLRVVSAGIIILLFTWHQVSIVHATVTICHLHSSLVASLRSNPGGVIEFEEPELAPVINPFVYTFRNLAEFKGYAYYT